MARKNGQFCWSRKIQGRGCKGVVNREPRSMERRHVYMGRKYVMLDEGVESGGKSGYQIED
jgi:hypothetical protein